MTLDRRCFLAVADIDGRATAVGFEAGAAVETAVDPRQWRWRRPEPGSARPLEIAADRLIDALAIHGALGLTDSTGARFPVDWTAKGFSIWAKPRGPWPCAPLELVAGPNLEDVCGNRPGEPFERATPRAAAASRAGATVHAA